MDNSDTIFFAAGGLLNGIAYLLIIAACVTLVIKRKSGPTILMLASQVLALFFYVGSFAATTISASQSAETLVSTTKIMALLGPLPHILFAIGLLWFAMVLAKRDTGQD